MSSTRPETQAANSSAKNGAPSQNGLKQHAPNVEDGNSAAATTPKGAVDKPSTQTKSMQFGSYNPAETDEQPSANAVGAPRDSQTAPMKPVASGQLQPPVQQPTQHQAGSKLQGTAPGTVKPTRAASGGSGPPAGTPAGSGQNRGPQGPQNASSQFATGRQTTANQPVPRQHSGGAPGHQRSMRGGPSAQHMANSMSPPGINSGMVSQVMHRVPPNYSGYAAAYQGQPAYFAPPGVYGYSTPAPFVNQPVTYYFPPGNQHMAQPGGYPQMQPPPPQLQHTQHSRQDFHHPGMQQGSHHGGNQQHQQHRNAKGFNRHGGNSGLGHPQPPHAQQGAQSASPQVPQSGGFNGSQRQGGQQDQTNQQATGGHQPDRPQPPRHDTLLTTGMPSGGSTGLPATVRPKQSLPVAPRKKLSLVNPDTKEDVSIELERLRKETESKEAAAKNLSSQGPGRVVHLPAVGDKSAAVIPPQVQRPQQRAAPERRPIAIVAPTDASTSAQPEAGSSPAENTTASKRGSSQSDSKPAPSDNEPFSSDSKDVSSDSKPAPSNSKPVSSDSKSTTDVIKDDTQSAAASQKAASDKAAEKAAAEKAASETAAVEKKAADKATAETTAAEKAKIDRAASQKAATDKAAAEKAVADKAAAHKAATDKAAADKAAADKAAADKAAADKAAADKAVADEAAADKAVADKAAADKAAAKKVSEQKVADDKAAADKVAADQAAMAKAAAEKAADEKRSSKEPVASLATASSGGPDRAKTAKVSPDEADTETEASSVAAQPMNAKAKRKLAMAKAELKGVGGEMDAYTVPKPAAEAAPSSPPSAARTGPPPTDGNKPKSKPSPPATPKPQESTVDEDWEAAEGTPALRSHPPGGKSGPDPKSSDASDGRKYSRDWLMVQMDEKRNQQPLSDMQTAELALSANDKRALANEKMPKHGAAALSRGGSMGGAGFGGGGRPNGPGPDDQRGSGPPGMGGRGMGGPPRGGPAPPSDVGQWGHTGMPNAPPGRGAGGPGGAPGMNRGGGNARPIGVQADVWARGTMQPPPSAPMAGGNGFHKAENSYKLGATRTADPEEEKKQKAFNSQLNKLTPDNFDRILPKLLEVGIASAKTLRGLIDRIFDKALTEVTFTALYAELCVSLNAKLPGFEDPDAPAVPSAETTSNRKPITFRRLLLNKCQEEFEAGDTAMKAVDAREKAAAAKAQKEAAKKEAGETGEGDDDDADDDVTAEDVASPEKADEADDSENKSEGEEKEEGEIAAPPETPAQAKKRLKVKEAKAAAAEYKARQRMLGNIQFIGQLYNEGMLTDRIMHECIVKLLGEVDHPRQEDVECLCKMLRTIGKTLESKGSDKTRMDVYFGRISQLAHNEKLESRVRFGLQDMRELRYNGWNERRKAEGPRKIAEVHAEAEEQKRQQRMATSRGPRHSGPDPRRRDFSDYGGPPRGQTGTPMDRTSSRPLNQVDGPLRPMSSQSTAGFGLRPGGPNRLGPAGTAPRATSPPRERKKLQLKPRSSAAQTPVEAPSEPSSPLGEASPPSEDGGGLSADDLKIVKPVLNEWVLRQNLSEGLLRYQEVVDAKSNMTLAVATWCNMARDERSGSWTWADISKMLIRLHSEVDSVPLSASSIQGGLLLVLESLADTCIDAPKFPVQIGGVIGDLVAEGILDMKTMLTRIQQAGEAPEADGGDAGLVESGEAASVAAAALEHLADAKGKDSARQAWTTSGISLKTLLMEADRSDDAALQKLVEKHNLTDVV